jgi:cyclic-di-GMP-binding biofilm dispersal mediator protein
MTDSNANQAQSDPSGNGQQREEWAPRPDASRQYQFNGTSALVAGATGGLGSAVAAELHARGAELTLVGRTDAKLAALPVSGSRLALDLRSPESCVAAAEAAVRHHGRLDVVVNATGVVAFGSVEDLSVDALEELMLTNAMLPIMLARAVLPHMSRGGVIVNISGVIAEKNLPGMAAYGASKAALRAFDEAFAREARRAGVRVIDARPPHTETELSQHPIEGLAPKLPVGLDPATVARVICDAIADGTRDLPSDAFTEAQIEVAS